MAERGRPLGAESKDKPFREALRMEIAAAGPDHKKLRAIARALIAKAEEGEGWAIQQIADRLDGKPAQESTVTIDDKRERSDWTPAELDALIDDARKSARAEKAASSGRSKLN